MYNTFMVRFVKRVLIMMLIVYLCAAFVTGIINPLVWVGAGRFFYIIVVVLATMLWTAISEELD